MSVEVWIMLSFEIFVSTGSRINLKHE